MNISDEAVAAGAKAFWFGEGSVEERMREALEAAAPHMCAPRYDQGGFLESGVSQVVNTTGKPIAIQTSPYRSQA